MRKEETWWKSLESVTGQTFFVAFYCYFYFYFFEVDEESKGSSDILACGWVSIPPSEYREHLLLRKRFLTWTSEG